METIELESWTDYPKAIADIPQKVDAFRKEFGLDSARSHVRQYDVRYRGLADSDWMLETTLERLEKSLGRPTGARYSLQDYFGVRRT